MAKLIGPKWSVMQALAGAFLCWLGATPSTAQVVDSVVTAPTRIYTTPGGQIAFTMLYTGGETAATDLAVTYTRNTTSAVLTPSQSCISPATPSPYTSANPNEFYVLWEPASGTYPANCGGAAAAASMATFSGIASTIPGGRYVIQVLNNAAAGAQGNLLNDVIVCQKVTVTRVDAPTPQVEGTPQVFTVNFAPGVVAGCEGFALPVRLTGAGTFGPDFAKIATNTCAALDVNAVSCSVTVTSTDNAVVNGDQAITLSVVDSSADSAYISAGKSANGTIRDNDSSVPTVSVFEFFNTNLVHYFRTAEVAEALAIDGGAAGPGWIRTGLNFKAYPAGSAIAGNDVCRFYNPVANTHFYTADPDECTQVRLPNSGWRFEGLSFRITLPTAGACPPQTIPVYRNYNNRFVFNDSNHRFTTSIDVYNTMKSQGWVGEGVVMCALGTG